MRNPGGTLSVYDGGGGAGSIGRWRGYSAISGSLLAGLYLVQGLAPGCDPEIVAALQADPELRGVAEVAAQPQGGIGGDAALSADQIIHPRGPRLGPPGP